jgi:hypothetical protein
MAWTPEFRRAVRRERLEAGLCAIVGCSSKYEPGKTMCQLHLTKSVEHARKVRDRLLATGTCQQCKKNPLVEGHKHCQRCLCAATERIQRNGGADSKKRYHERKAIGLCTKCGYRPSLDDSIYCGVCRERRRRYHQRYDAVQHKGRKARRARNAKLVFAHYGMTCKCCSQDWPIEMLTLGHVDDRSPDDVIVRRGNIHRTKLRAWLIEQGFPPGFITLCSNCKHAWWNYRCCPHAKDRLVPDVLDGRAVLRDPQTGKVVHD